MTRTEELRRHVMSMVGTDCRQELADTLTIIDQLEADFATLAAEVAALAYNDNREDYDTSKRFDDMVKLRGIELP